MTALPTLERYRALPAQHGMVLNSLRYPDDGVDLLQITLDWADPLEPEPFEAAWREVARRNPALRTAFQLHGEDSVVQVVDPDATIDLRWHDLPPEPDDAYESFLLADRRAGFDVTRAPLVRLTVLRQNGRAHRSVLTFHHALLDGRSMRLLVEEAAAAYAARRAGLVSSPPSRASFQEFVRWWYASDAGVDREFWTGYLADVALPQPLPGYLGTVPARARPRAAHAVLSRAESDRIRATAQRLGLGSSTMITAAWALLRARYGGVTDVVLAVTRSCRHGSIPDADTVMGLLINTVPLRVRIDPRGSVQQLLSAVSDGIQRIRDHQRAPLADILSWAGLPADTPALDTLVMFDRRRLLTELPVGDHGPVSARVDRLPSYPLSVFGYDEPELRLGMVWDGSRLIDGAAERMLVQLKATLVELADAPSAPVAGLDFGAAAEADLLAAWNRTADGYPRDATVPALFAAQVDRTPNAEAVTFPTGTWTYAELDRRSNALALALHRHGVGPDTPVAVAMPRSAELIAALLAVLKAGGAYLPIDPGTPPPRIAAMLAGVPLVLTTAATAPALPPVPGLTVIVLDDAANTAIRVRMPHSRAIQMRHTPAYGEKGGSPPPDRAHPLSLAYLSFTSGSTGTPRAVAVPHRAVVRLVSGQTFAPLGPGERLLQLAPVAFDASTLEIWGALLTGATVVVAPPGPLGLTEIAALLRTSGVTVAWLTAGLFHQLVEEDVGALAAVPWLLAGGDVLDPGAVRTALAARGGRPLVNGYGPTENTTFTACHVLTDQHQVGRTVPIGRPIRHTTVHILDPDGRPVPIGAVGELYTGGDGLARGYAGDPAATARAFVPDRSGYGSRLYRTGDLARWRADGTLEFIGRIDDQIKIRGFRVEPGEVEAVLRMHPGVREAVVVARGEGARRHLVGYVTRADGAGPDTVRPALLREFVAYRLPEYLVPAGFAVLDRLPLNANGKVDRAALPEPQRETRASTPPRTATEHRLADIWRSLLSIDGAVEIGREDGFFALGGNSLSAARLMFRIREVFGVDLPLGSFYATPTLAACAAAIEAATDAARPAPAGRGGTIRRSRREAYRVDRTELAPHLVPLTEGWALWRTVKLRAAGFPVDLLGALGDTRLAALADAVVTASDPQAREQAEAAYAAGFPDAVQRLGAALHAAASLPALREAVAWQNRHALTTGIDALVRRGPGTSGRNSKHRQHEALVASYLQRYCAKNDTIGFFGPVGWAAIDDGPGIRIQPAEPATSLRARVTYLEGWAVRAVLAGHTARLRPWLVPRRMPFIDVSTEDLLRLPLAPPVPLTPAEAAVMRACDGVRDARAVAAEVLADSTSGIADADEVFAVLAKLADNHRLAWQVDVPPQDIRPERTARTLLSRVTDAAVRAPAEAALDELTAARDELAAAAGDPDRVAAATAALEATFTRLTGATATRRAGALYAGRTLAYEECLRADTVRLGAGAYDNIRAALGLVLDSARWFTATSAALYTRRFDEIYRQRVAATGADAVPFADFWLLANDDLFEQPPSLVRPAVRALQERWAAIVGLPGTDRYLRLRASDLRARVAAAFPAKPLPWPTAVHHSPDLMIAEADGRFTWVLGELHPSLVTVRYAAWQAFRDDVDAHRAAVRHDLGRGTVYVAESAEDGGIVARLANVLHSPGDHRLVFAHDSCGYDPRTTLMVGECDVIDSPAGLRVRRRDGTFECGLLEVVGDLLAAGLTHTFHLLPPRGAGCPRGARGAHTPRVSIDDLVIGRESWTFPAGEPGFAEVGDERERYLRARTWAAGHDLPRHVFLRFTGERKPIYADLTSLASIDLISRSLRRARREAGAGATVTVVEMLPTPEAAWLTDAAGRRYTSELRMVAVDTGSRKPGA